MIVREKNARTQIAVLEDGVLVEHYVSNQAQSSMVGNVYLGRVQNVLPSMEAAFVDVGKGRNAVLYAGEVNWDAAGLEGGSARRIEQALKSGDPVLVQVTKDPIGHKGARLTSQVTLAGRYLVYVPGGGMTGISRKLPDTERNRLKRILREIVPDSAGVIVRTAAEGASARTSCAPTSPACRGSGRPSRRSRRSRRPRPCSRASRTWPSAWSATSSTTTSPRSWSRAPRPGRRSPRTSTSSPRTWRRRSPAGTPTPTCSPCTASTSSWPRAWTARSGCPSGGSLVIDRTEAMTVVDVNTGKFTGSGGTLEETVTRNNLEAAEEIVRQLRLRDIGGIIVIDFIDMVLESNRDLVLRRLVECLGRDRTKHQVAEVTSLGLVQMTRKRVGQGLVEAFSETCEHCHGRGFIVHEEPIEKNNQRPDAGAQQQQPAAADGDATRSRRKRGGAKEPVAHVPHAGVPVLPEAREAVKATLATIAAAAAHAHEHDARPRRTTRRPRRSTWSRSRRERAAERARAWTSSRSSPACRPRSSDDGPVEELELTAVPADVFAADEVAPRTRHAEQAAVPTRSPPRPPSRLPSPAATATTCVRSRRPRAAPVRFDPAAWGPYPRTSARRVRADHACRR